VTLTDNVQITKEVGNSEPMTWQASNDHAPGDGRAGDCICKPQHLDLHSPSVRSLSGPRFSARPEHCSKGEAFLLDEARAKLRVMGVSLESLTD
jgi:hypothetical protein